MPHPGSFTPEPLPLPCAPPLRPQDFYCVCPTLAAAAAPSYAAPTGTAALTTTTAPTATAPTATTAAQTTGNAMGTATASDGGQTSASNARSGTGSSP